VRANDYQSKPSRKLGHVLSVVALARATLDLKRDRDQAQEEARRLVEAAQNELAEIHQALGGNTQEQVGAPNTKGLP